MTPSTQPHTPVTHAVHKALHRPLTYFGVDRRLFFLSLMMGAAAFNLFYSFLAGLLLFAGLYGCAWWTTGHDPQLLRILLSSSTCRVPLRPPETRPVCHRGAAMVNVRRILRDYADAGALNSVLAIWGFVDDGTFITKAGDIGVAYRIAGVDYEGCDHPQRRDIVHRFEAALRQLDERYRVYQYLLKRRVEPFTTGTCAP